MISSVISPEIPQFFDELRSIYQLMTRRSIAMPWFAGRPEKRNKEWSPTTCIHAVVRPEWFRRLRAASERIQLTQLTEKVTANRRKSAR